MKQNRPRHINPLAIRLPISALVSITHRLSGIAVFVLIPMLLWSLGTSLASPEGLTVTKEIWTTGLSQYLGWILFAGILFHLLAGIRHMLMDLRFGDSRVGGRIGSYLVIISFLVLAGLAFWGWR